MSSANKVGDLFLAAGDAFTKLSQLAHALQSTGASQNFDADKWSIDDTELLKEAVKRFGDDLNLISERIKDKTMSQIKTTFRKIQPSLSTINTSATVTKNTGGSTPSSPTSPTVSGGHLTARLGNDQNMSKSITNTNSSNAQRILTTVSSMSTTTAISATSSATPASICSSPSPFLLRKSADITLNMLNSRDDSDDDGKVARSVFSSSR